MKSRSGITVIEMVMICACLGTLLTLLLPAIQAAREEARRTECTNHLKRYGLGIHNYHDTFRVLPPAGTGKAHRPMISWQVRILPFTEQMPLFAKIDMRLNDAVASHIPTPKNPKALAESHQVPYARCPSDESEGELPGWSALGTKESGLQIGEGGASGLAAQGSYCGSLGAQLTSPTAGSRATACDQYNTAPGDGDIFGNFEVHHGETAYGFIGEGVTLNNVETENLSDKLPINRLSGVFSENMFGPLSLAHMSDGTSNTFMAGEVLTMCTGDKNRLGWWHYQDYTNARGSVSVPLNTFTTCVTSENEAEKLGYLHPECASIAHEMSPATQASASNITWGFRSKHPGGANFLMGDGSVRFVSEEIDYAIYLALGGRDDGMPVLR